MFSSNLALLLLHTYHHNQYQNLEKKGSVWIEHSFSHTISAKTLDNISVTRTHTQ